MEKFQFQMCVWVVARLPQRRKSTLLDIFFFTYLGNPPLDEINFKKPLILVFEVVVQPSKHTFEIGIFPRFSSLCSTTLQDYLVLDKV